MLSVIKLIYLLHVNTHLSPDNDIVGLQKMCRYVQIKILSRLFSLRPASYLRHFLICHFVVALRRI
jgi:hypothetical protein